MQTFPLTELDQLNDPARWAGDTAMLAARSRALAIRNPVLLVGSSTFVMWKTLQDDLEIPNLCNHSFGGSTLYDLVFYAVEVIIPFSPRALVVSSGDNDLARGKHPKLVFEDFRGLAKLVWHHFPKLPVHFVTIKPSTGREVFYDRQCEVNGRIRDWSLSEERLHFIDTATPMLTDEGKPRPDIFVEDGIHMNAAGYAIWKKVLWPALSAYRIVPAGQTA